MGWAHRWTSESNLSWQVPPENCIYIVVMSLQRGILSTILIKIIKLLTSIIHLRFFFFWPGVGSYVPRSWIWFMTWSYENGRGNTMNSYIALYFVHIYFEIGECWNNRAFHIIWAWTGDIWNISFHLKKEKEVLVHKSWFRYS